LVIQLILAIALIVLEFMFKFTGFSSYPETRNDMVDCFGDNQRNPLISARLNIILSVSFAAIIGCTAFSAIIQIFVFRYFYKRCQYPRYNVYRIMSPKVCKFCYLLQSASAVASGLGLGHYYTTNDIPLNSTA
jgi:hypothetical protein